MLGALLAGCFTSPPQIIELIPNRGSVGVPGDAPITVVFDRGVVPSSVAGRFSVSTPIPGCNLDVAFHAGPAAACRIEWLNGDSEFRLIHARAILRPSTRYTFKLEGGVSDPAGVVNSVDHSWDIVTAPAPQVRDLQPADGSTGVPVDTPIAVSFSTAMAAATTVAAIRLDPPVPGTQVVRNTRDTSRFVVLPGTLLDSATTYRLTVAVTATDEHGQTLTAGSETTFTTGGLSPGPHAVILARRNDEAPTEVLLAPLSPAQVGEPASAQAVLTAPRCDEPAGCARAAFGDPLYTYDAAELSPGGRWLAVVETDATALTAPPVLVIVGTADAVVVSSFVDSSHPSWSRDGSTLAFSRAGSVALFRPASGALSVLPAGDAPVAPPVWGLVGEQLVLDVAGTADVEHLELADAQVLARYPVPGLTGGSSDPSISPDGAQLAMLRSAPGFTGTWLAGLGGAAGLPRLLDPNLVPIGFTAPGTLLAIDQPPAGFPVLVRVSVTGDVQIPLDHGPVSSDIASVVVSASGRQLVYLSPDAAGITQAYVENADGSDPVALTSFSSGSLQGAVVSLSE